MFHDSRGHGGRYRNPIQMHEGTRDPAVCGAICG